ncbi:hypothetical protein N9023_05010 [Opitutaceae bacterium]|nr:hypothetical protein [Opitutaceae bacterium]MDB4474346.1 hypothetical protein [Opitutaceae bacterium]
MSLPDRSKSGNRIAKIVPYDQPESEGAQSVAEHPAVGMWSNHDQIAHVAGTVRKLRRSGRGMPYPPL